MMIREQIKVEDYERIAKENEYFIWNFVRPKEDTNLDIISYFQDRSDKIMPHTLRLVLENISIPYYESNIEDSYDFLINLGIDAKKLWFTEGNDIRYFQPVLLGFHKRRLINSTFDGFCYCSEGIIELIANLNRKFLQK